MRVLTLKPDLTPTDYTQYYIDLDAANRDRQAVWKQHYTFTVN